MITINQVSTILKTARLDRDMTLEEAAKKTKIPAKHLLALEEADTRHYPKEPYCSLFVKDYADFLGLNGQEILSFFRRDYYQKKEPAKAAIKSTHVTPKTTFTLAVVFIIALFSVYLVNEYLRFSQPPSLKVNWPVLPLSLNNSVDIIGQTDTGATVRVNNDLVIVNSDGSFSKKIELRDNQTKVVIESKSPSGKVTTTQKILTVSQ